jgi:hypothetical protein
VFCPFHSKDTNIVNEIIITIIIITFKFIDSFIHISLAPSRAWGIREILRFISVS